MQGSHYVYTSSSLKDPFNNHSDSNWRKAGPIKDPFNPTCGHALSRGSSFTAASSGDARSQSRAPSSRTSYSAASSRSSSRHARSKSRSPRYSPRSPHDEKEYDSDDELECRSHLCPHHFKRLGDRSRSQSRVSRVSGAGSHSRVSASMRPAEDYFVRSDRRYTATTSLSHESKEGKSSRHRPSPPPPPYSRSNSYGSYRAVDATSAAHSRSPKTSVSRRSYQDEKYRDYSSDDDDYETRYIMRNRKSHGMHPVQRESTGNRIAMALASLCHLN